MSSSPHPQFICDDIRDVIRFRRGHDGGAPRLVLVSLWEEEETEPSVPVSWEDTVRR